MTTNHSSHGDTKIVTGIGRRDFITY